MSNQMNVYAGRVHLRPQNGAYSCNHPWCFQNGDDVDDLTPAIAHLVGLAELCFDYPLYVTVDSARGHQIAYLFAAKDEDGIRLLDTDPGNARVRSLLMIRVCEWDAANGKPKNPEEVIQIELPAVKRSTRKVIAFPRSR